MEIEIKKVNTFTRTDMPASTDTIETDFKLELMAPHITEVDVYYYDKSVNDEKSCAYWIIDIGLNDNSVFSLRLPKEMTEERIRAFVQPLLTLMNQSRKDYH